MLESLWCEPEAFLRGRWRRSLKTQQRASRRDLTRAGGVLGCRRNGLRLTEVTLSHVLTHSADFGLLAWSERVTFELKLN